MGLTVVEEHEAGHIRLLKVEVVEETGPEAGAVGIRWEANCQRCHVNVAIVDYEDEAREAGEEHSCEPDPFDLPQLPTVAYSADALKILQGSARAVSEGAGFDSRGPEGGSSPARARGVAQPLALAGQVSGDGPAGRMAPAGGMRPSPEQRLGGAGGASGGMTPAPPAEQLRRTARRLWAEAHRTHRRAHDRCPFCAEASA